jgi:hypothetical protein
LLAATTVAAVPDVFDQAATADFTAFVSASPLDPIRIVRGSDDDVSVGVEAGADADVLAPTPSELLDEHPVMASAEAITTPPTTRYILLCVLMSHEPPCPLHRLNVQDLNVQITTAPSVSPAVEPMSRGS